MYRLYDGFYHGTYIDGFEDIRFTSPIGSVQNDNLRIKLNLYILVITKLE